MRVLWLSVLIPVLLHAGWTEYRSGPFNVMTDAGAREGREVLAHFEQLRHVFGKLTGKDDAKSLWPVRIVVFKNPKDAAQYADTKPMSLASDEYVAAFPAGGVPPEVTKAAVQVFLDSNLAARMPANMEQALATLLSTLQVKATRVTLGLPPPSAERTEAWARLHMLATKPEYSGKVRVLLFNLQQGGDQDPAYRNAFEKSAAVIDKEAAAYFAAGQFEPVPFSGRPFDPESQFHGRDLEDDESKLRLAELLLAVPARNAAARAACQAVLNVNGSALGAHECLGLIALREGDKATAKQELTAATGEGNRSARAVFELARLNGNNQAELEKAAKMNPRWAEPYRVLAEIAPNPQRKAQLLKTAANLAPRDASLWRSLAELYTTQNEYSEAARAWAAADRSAADDKERAAAIEARAAIERGRQQHEDDERSRAAAEEAKAVQKLKDELDTRVHDAEAKANQTNSGSPAPSKVVPWFEGPKVDHVNGTLQRVECLARGQARLHVQTADGKAVVLLIRDPKQVVIMGGTSQATLGCGPLRPAREVNVEFLPKTPPEVTVVEFK
jgi:hypothetical protein